MWAEPQMQGCTRHSQETLPWDRRGSLARFRALLSPLFSACTFEATPIYLGLSPLPEVPSQGLGLLSWVNLGPWYPNG